MPMQPTLILVRPCLAGAGASLLEAAGAAAFEHPSWSRTASEAVASSAARDVLMSGIEGGGVGSQRVASSLLRSAILRDPTPGDRGESGSGAAQRAHKTYEPLAFRYIP